MLAKHAHTASMEDHLRIRIMRSGRPCYLSVQKIPTQFVGGQPSISKLSSEVIPLSNMAIPCPSLGNVASQKINPHRLSAISSKHSTTRATEVSTRNLEDMPYNR
jgi:hypothetical protein